MPKLGCVWLSAAMLLCVGHLCLAQEADSLEKSPLIDLVTRYVVEHPDASGIEVAAFANARLAEYGIDYVDDASVAPTEQILEADGRRFMAEIAEVPETSPCGAYYMTIPAVSATSETIDVIHERKKYTVRRPENLLLDAVSVYAPDQQTIISQFQVPWQKEPPVAVLPDGSAVMYIVGLGRYRHVGPSGEAALRGDFGGSYPTLLLQVSANGLTFVGDARLYDAGEPIEEIKEWPGAPEFHARQRRRFGHSGLVVEFPGPGPACT
jgi:hypothetical protein